MNKLALLLAVVLIAVLTGIVNAETGGPGKGSRMTADCGMEGQMKGAEKHMSRHLKGLNLDEQQKASVGEIKTRMMTETRARVTDMRVVQGQLRDLLIQDTVEMKAVEAKVQQLEMMRSNMHLAHIKAMEEIKVILTPVQKTKFKEMIKAGPMMGRMGMMDDQTCGKTGKKVRSKRSTMKE